MPNADEWEVAPDLTHMTWNPDKGIIGSLRFVLATRERELLELKGPCSNKRCRLHNAHSGPCDTSPAENGDTDE